MLIVGDAAARKAAADTLRTVDVELVSSTTLARHKHGLTDFDVLLLVYADSAKVARELARLNSGEPSPPILIFSDGSDDSALVAEATDFAGGRDIMVVSGLEDLAPRIAYATRRQRRLLNGHEDAASVSRAPVADALQGAKVLIVDDDIRNIYSLTSVLEAYGVEVLHAERGHDGILILEERNDVDVALIDIMMPEMDGYETMQQIRARPSIANVPLVAVTAKAMKGDRQKCLDAGASDYIAKPVDVELLLALLRVWINRGRDAARPVELMQAAAE
jgi:CheY-like chemotaxis protein